jgi:hypothetical protein
LARPRTVGGMKRSHTHISLWGAGFLALCIAAAAASGSASFNAKGAAAAVSASPPPLVTASSRGRRSLRASYAWPLKPFDRAHDVRAYFNDPRILGPSHSFHFGIDIAVTRPVAVYAVAPGTAHFANPHAFMVWHDPRHAFGYWHIVPVVRDGSHVQRYQLIGHTMRGWNHLHFGEFLDGRWVNPLRPGGIGPTVDHTTPRIAAVTVGGRRQALTGARVRGRVAIIADAYDVATGIEPSPWPVTPMRLRWRILRAGHAAFAWRIVIESKELLAQRLYHRIYAPGTRQNQPGHPGDYKFWLAHGWDSSTVRDGSYVLQVAAEDVAGNTTVATAPFVVDNR